MTPKRRATVAGGALLAAILVCSGSLILSRPEEKPPEAKPVDTEIPTQPSANLAPTQVDSPPPVAQAQTSKRNAGRRLGSETTPDFLPPTAPLAEPESSTPKQKVLVTEVIGHSPMSDSFRIHYMLARQLKEKGHEITLVGKPSHEYRFSVGTGPVQNLGSLRDLFGMTPDKWIAPDKVNMANYGVVLAAGDRPDALVYQAQDLGKLIVIGQNEGPWVFERDKNAANAAEKRYLKAQADRGYLQKNKLNELWRNAPWWDEKVAIDHIKKSELWTDGMWRAEKAAINHSKSGSGIELWRDVVTSRRVVATASDGVTSITPGYKFGAMRPCDVASWKNIVSYNVHPDYEGRRRSDLDARGYLVDRRGYNGMSGYSFAALDKFAYEILCPAVERAIQIHKETPAAAFATKISKASYLPPRPSLPGSFPLERPKREGKVVCWGRIDGVAHQAKARAIPDNLRAVQIACSYLPTTCLALKPDGTVVAWGNDENICKVPAGLTNVVQVALGQGEGMDSLAAALKANGTVVAWGKGAEKLQCDLSGIVQVAVGNRQVIGLKADGTLAAAQPKDPQGRRSNLPRIKEPLVQIAGGRIPLGLTCGGKVVALESRPDRSFYIPSELGEVASLAECHNSQAQQSAVILIDGTAASWGRNGSGQASVPDGLADIVQLSTSGNTTIAVKRDGSLVGWGDNWWRQLLFPTSVEKVIQVAAGDDVTLAIVEDCASRSPERPRKKRSRDSMQIVSSRSLTPVAPAPAPFTASR